MKITRMYTGSDGQSHIEKIDIPMEESMGGGKRSKPIKAKEIYFVEWPPGIDDRDWHSVSQRRLAIVMEGKYETEVSDGTRHLHEPGDIILVAEDAKGRGHRRHVGNQPVKFVTVELDEVSASSAFKS